MTNKLRGMTDVKIDIKRHARKPGKRTSKYGDVYYENRKNRADRSKWL